jgi:hypothetical protein
MVEQQFRREMMEQKLAKLYDSLSGLVWLESPQRDGNNVPPNV